MINEDSIPMQKYRVMVNHLAAIRTRNGGHYSQAEGSLLEDMTATWLELSEAETVIAEWIVRRYVPTVSRPTLDSAFMLPSFNRKALMMGIGAG